jgi:hypothetical protein
MGNVLHDSRHEIASKRREKEERAAREQEEAVRMPTEGRFTEGKSARLVRKARRERLKELPLDVMDALKPAVETFRGDALAFTDFERLVEQALQKRPAAGPRNFLLPDRGESSIHALHFAAQLV